MKIALAALAVPVIVAVCHTVAADVRGQVAEALFDKGVALGQEGKCGEAIAVYEEIVRRFGADASPDVREWVAAALFNKGATLGQQGKNEEAIAVYEEVVRRFGADTSPGMREWIAAALVNKGVTLEQQGKPGEAIAVYEETIVMSDSASPPAPSEEPAIGSAMMEENGDIVLTLRAVDEDRGIIGDAQFRYKPGTSEDGMIVPTVLEDRSSLNVRLSSAHERDLAKARCRHVCRQYHNVYGGRLAIQQGGPNEA
jgi:tetratricopeptide (TPR) repeat protein